MCTPRNIYPSRCGMEKALLSSDSSQCLGRSNCVHTCTHEIVQLGQLHFAAALIRARGVHYRAIFFAKSRICHRIIVTEFVMNTSSYNDVNSPQLAQRPAQKTRPSAETKSAQRNYSAPAARTKYCGSRDFYLCACTLSVRQPWRVCLRGSDESYCLHNQSVRP
jgi:hypothetical protein